jgi:transcriptional regulator with XRE-family HTH domain
VSERTSDRRISLWEKFKDKAYRDGFVASHLANNIAAQIFSTRELRGLTQTELAEMAGMAQARISVMEYSGYENFSVKTLKRLASALDVALVVRFVPFSELADYATNITPDKVAVREFKSDSLMPVKPFARQGRNNRRN